MCTGGQGNVLWAGPAKGPCHGRSPLPQHFACLGNAPLQIQNVLFECRGGCHTPILLLLLLLLLRGRCCLQHQLLPLPPLPSPSAAAGIDAPLSKLHMILQPLLCAPGSCRRLKARAAKGRNTAGHCEPLTARNNGFAPIQ